MNNVLKDFYLQNATVLIKRLSEALPDDYLGLKSYVNEVHKELITKVGDPHYTRKMGLLDTARCLNKTHQEQFLNLVERNADMFHLKEPFDREVRGKMLENRKLLSGMDKHKQLGTLPKQKYDEVCLYTTNVKARPANLDKKEKKETPKKSNSEKKNQKKTKKEKKEGKKKQKESVETKKQTKVKSPETVKRKSSTVKKQDLLNLVDTIMVSLTLLKRTFVYKLLTFSFRLLMSNKQSILRYFDKKPVTMVNIIACSKLLYEYHNFRVQNILSTNYFLKIVNEVLTTVKASPTMKKSVHNNLFDTIMSYRVKSDASVAHAPAIDPVKLRLAIFKLYYDRSTKRGKQISLIKLRHRKFAALQALFCSVTARRWMDISRIRWESIKFKKYPARMKVKFSLPASKANFKGKRNEFITLVQDFSDLCPIKLLFELWIQVGRPKFGFVFPCIHKNVVYTTDCVEQWESFRCKGHRSGAKIRPCLGQINGDTTWNIYKKAAKDVGCKVIPKRHTFRRLACIIAHKFNMSRDQITTTFGWKFDSIMPNHYLQDEWAVDDNGFATKLAKSIEKDPQFSFMSDLFLQ